VTEIRCKATELTNASAFFIVAIISGVASVVLTKRFPVHYCALQTVFRAILHMHKHTQLTIAINAANKCTGIVYDVVVLSTMYAMPGCSGYITIYKLNTIGYSIDASFRRACRYKLPILPLQWLSPSPVLIAPTHVIVRLRMLVKYQDGIPVNGHPT